WARSDFFRSTAGQPAEATRRGELVPSGARDSGLGSASDVVSPACGVASQPSRALRLFSVAASQEYRETRDCIASRRAAAAAGDSSIESRQAWMNAWGVAAMATRSPNIDLTSWIGVETTG